jgi:hypothetical protein
MTSVDGKDGAPVGPGRWPCRRWGLTWLAGAIYFAALFCNLDADGGREAAWVFGTINFAFTFPLIILLGRFLGAGLKRLVTLGDRARRGLVIAPTLVLTGFVAVEAIQTRNPAEKFRRYVVSPVPASVDVLSAWSRSGINWRAWAFHFTIAREDLPKILARSPFRHEVGPDDFSFHLDMLRDSHGADPDFPLPTGDFRAAHRYRHHAPTSRSGRDVTLYGNASQTEFYLYGFSE